MLQCGGIELCETYDCRGAEAQDAVANLLIAEDSGTFLQESLERIGDSIIRIFAPLLRQDALTLRLATSTISFLNNAKVISIQSITKQTHFIG